MSVSQSIVQHLRAIQHDWGYLPPAEMSRLAASLDIPLHRVQEVASCFPLFRHRAPPDLQVEVCRDVACHLRGAAAVRRSLDRMVAANPQFKDLVEVGGVSCLGRCDRAPAMRLVVKNPAGGVQELNYLGRTPEEACNLVGVALSERVLPAPDLDADWLVTERLRWRIDIYEQFSDLEPYSAIRRFIDRYPVPRSLPRGQTGDINPKEVWVLQELEKANLLGMGGAGMPAARKWTDVLLAQGTEKYIVCNGDESEPTTFKDRELLQKLPHLVLEGLIVAGLLTNATRGYIYIRHEYEEQIEAVEAEIERAVEMGVCGENILETGRNFPVEVFVSPGGYICGEQSALLEAMEDRRAEPRNRPPELMTNGLYDKPTIVNNVETFSWVPYILVRGGETYAKAGKQPSKGRRLFSVCGDVAHPGVYEVAIGTTFGQLLEKCGGMKDGQALVAWAPSGPSGGFLPAVLQSAEFRKKLAKSQKDAKPGTIESQYFESLGPAESARVSILNLPLDLNFLRGLGLMLGAGMTVYGEKSRSKIREHSLNALEFFRNETCGKCVPCRLGTQRLVEINQGLNAGGYNRQTWDETAGLAKSLARTMETTAICGLGGVAFNPLLTLIEHFPDEIQTALTSPRTT